MCEALLLVESLDILVSRGFEASRSKLCVELLTY